MSACIRSFIAFIMFALIKPRAVCWHIKQKKKIKIREPLSVGDFEWMSDDEIAFLSIEQVPNDAATGYIL